LEHAPCGRRQGGREEGKEGWVRRIISLIKAIDCASTDLALV
jgi:hypothetical protein